MYEKSINQKENIARINLVLEHIEKYLDRDLSLSTLSKIAFFSPFHFHRLFTVIVGETLNGYIVRKRIERAASYLMHKKDKLVTEIAEETGFATISSFSRAFKKFYGISPSNFKKISPLKYSKICKTKSKDGQIKITFEQYICTINNALNWLKMNAKMEVKQMEKLEIAYISHKGNPELLGDTFKRLITWAMPNNLMNENTRMLTIYHDSPKITDLENLRMSAGIILNHPIKTSGEINLRSVAACKCIVSRLEITPSEFKQAWESSFTWMIESGYTKSDIEPYEIYYNNAEDHPEKKFIVDLCIPIN